jgi:phenylalanyl-tRNA synthetase beta chain
MTGLGANEVQTYSFVSPRGVDNVRIGGESWERNFVRLINPLGEENSVMRTVLTPNMMEVLARNYARNIPKVRAFEIGNTFINKTGEEDALPEERNSMVAACYGEGESFFTLKGMLEELFAFLGIHGAAYVPESEYTAPTTRAVAQGSCTRIRSSALWARFIPTFWRNNDIGTRCWCCELYSTKS